MPGKDSLFTPSSILFRPRHMTVDCHLVEAPGTAPGSERFIITAVYHHSWSSQHRIYRRFGRGLEGLLHKTCAIVMVAGIDSHTRLGNIPPGKAGDITTIEEPRLEGLCQILVKGNLE
jgi:hypothetical protein